MPICLWICETLKCSYLNNKEDSISFSYGDLFPTMCYEDDRPYRKQVYTQAEIVTVIDKFGLPQEWNSKGDKGPERYIEVQIWDEEVIEQYRKT